MKNYSSYYFLASKAYLTFYYNYSIYSGISLLKYVKLYDISYNLSKSTFSVAYLTAWSSFYNEENILYDIYAAASVNSADVL